MVEWRSQSDQGESYNIVLAELCHDGLTNPIITSIQLIGIYVLLNHSIENH